MSLILIKCSDSNQLDSFGILLSSNGRGCLPSLSDIVDNKGTGCLIPQHYKEDPSLGIWVNTQCSRCNKIDPTHQERLESTRFVWNPFDQQWEDMFAKLEEYCQQHGDCLVPRNYKDDPSLGTWVQQQHKQCAKLDSAHCKRLKSLGFVWHAKCGCPASKFLWDFLHCSFSLFLIIDTHLVLSKP
jgi:hypothetical protein